MNKMKNTSMRVLLLTCFGLMLCINCTNADNQTFALIDETMDIISPAGESSFAEGENIVFQWEQTDANVQQPDVFLDNQIINIVAGDMLPELPVGEHTLKLILKEKMMDEVIFFVHEEKPVAISFETLQPPEPFGRDNVTAQKVGIQSRLEAVRLD